MQTTGRIDALDESSREDAAARWDATAPNESDVLQAITQDNLRDIDPATVMSDSDQRTIEKTLADRAAKMGLRDDQVRDAALKETPLRRGPDGKLYDAEGRVIERTTDGRLRRQHADGSFDELQERPKDASNDASKPGIERAIAAQRAQGESLFPQTKVGALLGDVVDERIGDFYDATRALFSALSDRLDAGADVTVEFPAGPIDLGCSMMADTCKGSIEIYGRSLDVLVAEKDGKWGFVARDENLGELFFPHSAARRLDGLQATTMTSPTVQNPNFAHMWGEMENALKAGADALDPSQSVGRPLLEAGKTFVPQLIKDRNGSASLDMGALKFTATANVANVMNNALPTLALEVIGAVKYGASGRIDGLRGRGQAGSAAVGRVTMRDSLRRSAVVFLLGVCGTVGAPFGHAQTGGEGRPPDRAEEINNCPHRASHTGCAPLEFYNVETLVVKALSKRNGRAVATVAAPDGTVADVTQGDKLGRGGWVVSIVSDNSLTVIGQGKRTKDLLLGQRLAENTDHQSVSAEGGSAEYEYLLSLGELFGTIHYHSFMVELCSRKYPELADGLRAVLGAWQERNAEVIRLVAAHMETMARYKSMLEQSNTEDIIDRNMTEVRVAVNRLVEAPDGADSCRKEFRSLILAKAMSSSQDEQLKNLTLCKELRACPAE